MANESVNQVDVMKPAGAPRGLVGFRESSRVGELGASWEGGGPESGTEALGPFPTPGPMRVFHLATGKYPLSYPPDILGTSQYLGPNPILDVVPHLGYYGGGWCLIF